MNWPKRRFIQPFPQGNLLPMNYLAHLHLGGPRPAQLLGSLYGDFVKGPLRGRFSAEIEAAIAVHRRIDAYTDSHPVVLAGKARFTPGRRRFAGILLDVFFDHCLARDWSSYAAEDLRVFSGRVYRLLGEQSDLPGRLTLWAPRMAEQDWLGSYRYQSTLRQVVAHLGKRLPRPGCLDGAYEELAKLYGPLSEDFAAFYPDLWRFAEKQRKAD